MSRSKNKIHARAPDAHPEDPRGPALCKAISDQGLSFASGKFGILINCKTCLRVLTEIGNSL